MQLREPFYPDFSFWAPELGFLVWKGAIPDPSPMVRVSLAPIYKHST